MNNSKNLSLLFVCLSILGSSCMRSVRHDLSSLETLLVNTVGVVFCEPGKEPRMFERPDTRHWDYTSEIITDSKLVSEWRQTLSEASPVERTSLPFVGHLASLFFLDHEQNPIAQILIVNWKCTGNVFPIPRYRNKKNGVIVNRPEDMNKDNCFTWQSEPFVRSVYNYMRVNRSNQLQYIRDLYPVEFESLLFEGIEVGHGWQLRGSR